MKSRIPSIISICLIATLATGCASNSFLAKKQDNYEKFSTQHLMQMAEAFEAQGDTERARELYKTIVLRDPNKAYLTENNPESTELAQAEPAEAETNFNNDLPTDAVPLESVGNSIQQVGYEADAGKLAQPYYEETSELPSSDSIELTTAQHEKALIDDLQAFEGNSTILQEQQDLHQFAHKLNEDEFWNVPKSDGKNLVMNLPELKDYDSEEAVIEIVTPEEEVEMFGESLKDQPLTLSNGNPYASDGGKSNVEVSPLEEEVVFFPEYAEEQESVPFEGQAPVAMAEPQFLPTGSNELPAVQTANRSTAAKIPVKNPQVQQVNHSENVQFQPSQHALNMMQQQAATVHNPAQQAPQPVIIPAAVKENFELPIINPRYAK